MDIRPPRQEWVEAFAGQVATIREAVRLARGAPADWRWMVTDGMEIADVFGDRDDWQSCLSRMYDHLGVAQRDKETIIALCRRLQIGGS